MDYWKRRDLIERVRLFDTTEAQLKKLLKREYLRVYKQTRIELLDLINSLPDNPTANDIYKEDKLYKLLNELQFKMDHLAEFEKEHMEETFHDYYIENAQQGITFDLPIDDARVYKAINDVWCGDGKNFSDRIWTDKRKLLERLKDGLVNTITTGSGWGEFSKSLKHEFGTSYSNATRLVRTELSHIQNESTLDKYKAEGVEQVRFVAELDNRTCDKCSKFDGMVFPIDKAPKIPCHCNCRCTYIPVIKIGNA